MNKYPKKIEKVRVPPIKSQGIKTKLINFIAESIHWDGSGKWIEPFMGSGSVVLNLQPERALISDTNHHLIGIYKAIQSGDLTADKLRQFLETEGSKLKNQGEPYYYEVRERFNEYGNPYDFLFLNRSCFNGMIRFNSKGGFNVPFCKKEERFRQAYITKICNQISWAASVIEGKDWEFVAQDWDKSLALSEIKENDFVYLDPPYIGRSADYFNKWDDQEALLLEERIKQLPCRFAYSMWLRNTYRENDRLIESFTDYEFNTFSHFYHLGASESLRNEMEEALILNFKSNYTVTKESSEQVSLSKDSSDQMDLF